MKTGMKNMRRWKECAVLSAAMMLLGNTQIATADTSVPPLVPWPKSVTLGQGTLKLKAGSRIVAAASSLVPLAQVLADEIARLGGLQLKSASDAPRSGDIVLRLDQALTGEAYQIVTQDQVVVSGGNYAAVAMGTVTLLQAVKIEGGACSIPAVTIKDEPRYGYRGLMLDVARKPHSIDSLRQVIQLCRLYKVRYLHLHLTDNEAFTFPSTAFPQLASRNQSYKLDELRALVKYADERGVTLVPELEAPGHCGAMQSTMPDTFGMIGPDGKPVRINCLNFMNPKVYPALDTLVGEMCDVFRSSPYIHIGSDEAWLGEIGPRPETAAYLKEHNLSSVHELYTEYIAKMNETVKKHGKQTIVWEGFGGTGSKSFKIPTDVIVMEFEVRYNPPQDLIKNGYPVINASWTPLYVVNGHQQTPEHLFGWEMSRFGQVGDDWEKIHWTKVDPTPLLTGAQMCAWEQPEWLEIPSLRKRVAAMSQQVWSPGSGGDYAAFALRLAATESMLDRMLYGFTLEVAQAKCLSECVSIYQKEATVTARPLSEGLSIRYTLNGQEPAPDSPLLEGPLKITEKNGVDQGQQNAPKSLRTTLRVAAFRGSAPVGSPRIAFLDNYDYLQRLPKAVTLKIYDNPGGAIKRPDMSQLKLLAEKIEPHVWPNAVQDLPEHSVLVYKGKIDVVADGQYEFGLRSERGGSQLYINDELVCDRSGQSNWDYTTATAKLTKGSASFRVECYLAARRGFFDLWMVDPLTKKPMEWTKLLIPLDQK